MNNQSIIKYKKYALLGILGTILFMLGDWLLDVKPIDNITNGFVESGWMQMSMWRFEVSILLGAIAVPFWFLGLISIGRAIKDKSKTAGNLYLFGTVVGCLGGLLIHTFCNFLPIIFKIIYKNNGDSILTTNMVNHMAKYVVVPFVIYFVILELFTAIPFMYAILGEKLKIPKWKAFCNPAVTILLAAVMNKIPFYPLNAVAGSMESFGHLLMCMVIFQYYKERSVTMKKVRNNV